jgi:hypothetical protein
MKIDGETTIFIRECARTGMGVCKAETAGFETCLSNDADQVPA